MKSSNVVLAMALLLCFLMAGGRIRAQGPTYTVTVLGTLPGGSGHSIPVAINRLGQAVGSAADSNGNNVPFLWLPVAAYNLPAGMNNLGTLGGTYGRPYSINDNGQVAGMSYLANGAAHAFLWTPGGNKGPAVNPQMQDLGVMSPYVSSVATSVNNLGQVAGYQSPRSAGATSQGFLWLPTPAYGLQGGASLLGKSTTSASLINDAGQVIVNNSSLWVNGVVYSLPVTSPVINNYGQVAGLSGSSASLWTPYVQNGLPAAGGVLTNIIMSDSTAAVNNLGPTGIVVGQRYNTVAGHQEGWIWLPSLSNGTTGSFYLLANQLGTNPYGFIAVIPYAVNASGQVVGFAAQAVGGPLSGVVLTPQ